MYVRGFVLRVASLSSCVPFTNRRRTNMPVEITMPQQSDTMTEGTVIKWLKKEGDKVKAGEVIAEIETDKATMEMEAFDSGTLATVLVKEGQKAPVGGVIAVMASGKETVEEVKKTYAGGAPAPVKQPQGAPVAQGGGAKPQAAAPAVAPAPSQGSSAAKKTGSYQFDLIVIGGGPAGYAAAIRAGQLKKRVLCVEKENLGGTCLNWGCIPTKALLDDGAFIRKLRTEADKHGVSYDNLKIDFTKLVSRSRTIAGELSKGIGFLFSKANVKHEMGIGQLLAPHRVKIKSQQGEKEVT